MTVGATGNRFSYAGDGVTKTFPFPRPFFDHADLRVILVDAAGVETVKGLATDYSVAGGLEAPSAGWLISTEFTVDDTVKHDGSFYICTVAHTSGAETEPGAGGGWTGVWALVPEENGGEITMMVAPTAGETLIVTRRTDLKQNTNYDTGGRFSAEAHEDALDKGVLIAQDLAEQLSRAPKLKESSQAQTPTFPEAEGATFLAWNASGTDLENVGAGPGTGNMLSSIYDPGDVGTDAFDMDNMAETATAKVMSDVERAKLAEIEASADVTDATNVAAAGAVMTTGTQTIAGAKTFTTEPIATVGTSTTLSAYLLAQPTDYGVGKPRLAITKRLGATTWGIGLFDTVDDTGTLQLEASQVTTTGAFTVSGAFTSGGIDDNATSERVQISNTGTRFGNPSVTGTYDISQARTDAILALTGSTSSGFGGNIRLFGNDHGTQANDIELRSATSTVLRWDDSANVLTTSGNAFTCGAFTSSGIDDNATGERLDLTDSSARFGTSGNGYTLVHPNDDQNLAIQGGITGTSAAFIIAYGGSHATLGGDLVFRTGATTVLHWDSSSNLWNFQGNTLTCGALTSTGIQDAAPSQRILLGDSSSLWGESNTTASFSILRRSTTGFLALGGSSSGAAGANVRLFGASHATVANDVEFRSATTITLLWDDSAGFWNFQNNPINNINSLQLATNTGIFRNINTSNQNISGGTAGNIGANYLLYGGTHATQAHDHVFRTGGTTRLQWDHSALRWTYQNLDVASIKNLTLGGTTSGNGTNTLHLLNGTAPTGGITNGGMVYTKDVSGSAEVFAQDEGGIESQLTSHGPTLFSAGPENPLGYAIKHSNCFLPSTVNPAKCFYQEVDVVGAIAEIERLSGKTFIYDGTGDTDVLDWATEKERQATEIDAENLEVAIQARESRIEELCSQDLEVAKEDAIEVVELFEEVEDKNTEKKFIVNSDTGEVEEVEIPVMLKIKAGEKRCVKEGVRFDDATGKFFRRHARKEAEAIVGELIVPEAVRPKQPPAWIADRLIKKAGNR